MVSLYKYTLRLKIQVNILSGSVWHLSDNAVFKAVIIIVVSFHHNDCRFVVFRDVTWEDLAFFNADLFEGLSRMVLDSHHPMMTSERFQATYCCHFEVNVHVRIFSSIFSSIFIFIS